MSSKQGDNRSKIKHLCLYALLTAVCLIFGYIESLVSLSFIAPGIKLGISNSVALLLICNKDIKGAFAVNISRILLSALIFGSVYSLLFSFCAGVISVSASWFVSKFKGLSAVGISVFGAVIHNTVQCLVALFVVGKGVFYYLPILIVFGIISGSAIGFSVLLLNKKINKSLF